MPTYEHAALLQQKDQNGDMHIVYPITKAENVDGLYEGPTLTGVPKAPTAASGTNTTQIATTEFVQNAISGLGGSSSGSDTENVSSTTTFADDGSVTVTYVDGRSITTVFNADGSITETTYINGVSTKVKTTVFTDNEIQVTIT